jgi:hypothetical protein
MSVTLIGGMDRLERIYEKEAESLGIRLKVFTKTTRNLGERIGNVDAVILFTNKVSHPLRREVMSAAKKKNIKALQCHACGVCSLRQCLNQLIGQAACPMNSLKQ